MTDKLIDRTLLDVWFESKVLRKTKFEELRRSFKKSMYNGFEFVCKSECDGMTVDNLMLSYFHEAPHYKSGKSKLPRYGELFTINIPRTVDDLKVKQIVRDFVYMVTYGENKLPYVAYMSYKPNNYIVSLWIADREYVTETKVYPADYVFVNNKQVSCVDGKYFRTVDGERTEIELTQFDSIRVYKKGSPKLDSEGKPIVETGWASKKSRIFTENYETLMPKWLDMMRSVINRLMTKAKGFLRYKNRKNSKSDLYFVDRKQNEFVRRLYRELAEVQHYIKYSCWRFMVERYNYEDYEWERLVELYDIGSELKPIELHQYIMDAETSKPFRKLFKKYKEMFERGKYLDDMYIERKLFGNVSYSNTQVFDDIQYMKKMFKTELYEVLAN